MRLILSFCFLVSFTFFGFGQRFSVSLKGFQNYLPDSSSLYQTYQYSEISLDRASLPDSIYINQVIRSRAQTDVFITSNGGIGLSGNMELNLAPKWAFEIGAGIDFFNFNVRRDAEAAEVVVVSEEIVPPPPITVEPPCDRFISDGQDVLDGDNFRMLNLYIPAKVYYSIWDGEIRFFAGGYFASTFFSDKKSSELSLKRENIEGETLCIFSHNLIEEDPSEDLQGLNYGALGGIEYTIFKKLAVNFSFERSFSYFFTDNRSVPSLKDDFPQTASNSFAFGIKYFLNP